MSAYDRKRSRCDECPLAGRPVVRGCGSPGGIVFLGEAPGSEEERQLEPFVGPAGIELYKACKGLGIELYQHWKMNVTNCRLPQNDFQSLDAIDARKACHKGFEDEVQHLRDLGSRVVVALGQNVTTYLGIPGAISKVRGSVFETRGMFVVPTYHPAFFARHRGSWKQSDGGVVEMKVAWLNDLNKAKRIAAEGWKPPVEDFNIYPTVEDVVEFANNVIKDNSLVAVDIETTGLNPEYGDIVVVGLADSSTHGISIPYLRKGGEMYWQNGDRKAVVHQLNRIFVNNPLVFQNAFFDLPFLKEKGFEITYESVQHDSLILHHTISPEQKHDLGYIVSIYGDTPYWKADLLDRRGTILQMDDRTLRTYNLRDCVVLHQILPEMLDDLDRMGSRDVYFHEAIPLIASVGAMMDRGIRLNRKKLHELKTKYEEKVLGLEAELRKMWKLPEAMNFDAPDDWRWLFFTAPPTKFKRLKELERYDEGLEKPLKKETKKYQDLLTLVDLRDNIQHFHLPTGFVPRKTKKGNQASTDEQVITGMILAMNNRVEKITGFKTEKALHLQEKDLYEQQIGFLEKYLEYKEAAKILSTYTDYKVHSDGRIHTRFILHGTNTGRLASREPNLMNLPKEVLELRTPFAASPGMVLLSADYSNLEVRILAAITRDPVLLQLLEDGVNIHDDNTRTLFGFDEDHPRWKLGRAAAKVFQFGGIQYGGGDREIFERVLLKAPKLGLTFNHYVQAKARWMDAHPAYRAWKDAVIAEAHRSRRSVCWNGRVRELMGRANDIEKQALNTPIQGGAAAVINQAMIRLHRRLQASGVEAYLLLQIHDQLVWEVAKTDLVEWAAIVREEMERPIPVLGVDLPIDLEVGPNLGSLKEYKSGT